MQALAPLTIAIVLLLLPLVYVGSYLALVAPRGLRVDRVLRDTATEYVTEVNFEHYRLGGKLSERIFWPVEKFDRWIRHETWNPRWEQYRTGRAEVLP